MLCLTTLLFRSRPSRPVVSMDKDRLENEDLLGPEEVIQRAALVNDMSVDCVTGIPYHTTVTAVI